MNRPSHWLLAFFGVVGGILLWTGELGRFLQDPPGPVAPESARGPRTVEPVVVRRQGQTAPKPVPSEVRGQVIDRLGWPVPAAEVRVVGLDIERLDVESVYSGGDGRFSIEVPGAPAVRLRVVAKGRHQTAEVIGGVDEVLVVMQDALPWCEGQAASAALEDASSMLVGEGSLRDSDGNHVAFGRVAVRQTGVSVRTDDTGRFLIPLPRGESTLVAWDDHGRVAVSDSLRLARTQGKVPLADLRLESGARLSGVLKDADGEVCVGAMLVLENGGIKRQTMSGAGGFFDIKGLLQGASRLFALPFHGNLGVSLDVRIDRDVDVGDVALERPRPLRLRVVSTSSLAHPRVHVVAEEGEDRRAYGQTDEVGEVVLAGLGHGPFRFEVRGDDPEFTEMQVGDYDPNLSELVVDAAPPQGR